MPEEPGVELGSVRRKAEGDQSAVAIALNRFLGWVIR